MALVIAYRTSRLAVLRCGFSLRCAHDSSSHGRSREAENVDPIPVVDYAYVKKLDQSGKGTIIDVREPEELKELGKIPSAVNIRLSDVSVAFAKKPKELGKAYGLKNVHSYEDEIVFHCMRGIRAHQACETAKKLGYENVKNYSGSFVDWMEREKGRNH